VAEAEALRSAGQLPPAIALLEAAAAVDGAVRPRLEEARSEHARRVDAEYLRLEREGDLLVGKRRWADAQERYAAAARVRPKARAATLARYAAEMRAADAAVQARDWARATQAYQAAVALGIDPDGHAAQQLDAVRLRPIAFELRAVLVHPARPDGQPWAGERTRVFDAVMIGARASERALEKGDPSALQTAIEVATGVPQANQPELSFVLDVGGRRFETPARRALYATPDAHVVVAANAYDDRVLTVRVVQRGVGDVGAVQVRLADLLVRGRVALRSGSLARVDVAAAPVDAPEWSAVGCAPEGVPVATPSRPPPAPRRRP
jgi:hypothetical protein